MALSAIALLGNGHNVIGRNNPTFASSNKNGHVPGMAADGDWKSCWKASDEDASPYWTLDTEKRLLMKEIQLYFPEEILPYYDLEVSDDKSTWRTVDEKGEWDKNERCVVLTLDGAEVSGRFVRIRFTGNGCAALSEVIVKGIVCE